MGMAGAGKGTQAKMLVEKNGYSLISTGDLFRQHATEDQKRRMLAGELLRDDEIYVMIGKELDKLPDLNHAVLDGTPRSIPQADWILSQVDAGRFSIKAVIHLGVTEEEVRKRLLSRGRADDTDAGISKRFEEYRNNTVPILDHLKDRGIPVIEVDGSRDPDAVHEEILGHLE